MAEGRARASQANAGDRNAIGDALAQLSRRPRTVSEMRRYLAARGHGPRAIARAVRRMSELGYLDDGAVARNLAARARAEKPMGRLKLTFELRRRGIEPQTIEAVLATAFDAEAEAEALDLALRKAAKGIPAPADARQRRRLASFLLRRGFRAAQVTRVVGEWFGPMHEEGPGDRSLDVADEE